MLAKTGFNLTRMTTTHSISSQLPPTSVLPQIALSARRAGKLKVPSPASYHSPVVDTRTEMAGNIIPAIATTNAIISGLIILQALHLLRKSYMALKNVHVHLKATVPLSIVNLCPPNPSCGICRDTYTKVQYDPERVTLGELVEGILGDGAGEDGETGRRDVSIYEDKRAIRTGRTTTSGRWRVLG